MRRFERLDAGCWCLARSRRRRWWWVWIERPADGVDSVKGSSQNQVVVTVELLKARVEGAVVD